jgi:hypothetical protein
MEREIVFGDDPVVVVLLLLALADVYYNHNLLSDIDCRATNWIGGFSQS